MLVLLKLKTTLLLTVISLVLCTGACTQLGTPSVTALNENLLRGCMTVREINWAGSMTNDGIHDPEDDFIEFENTDCGIPTDITGWKLVFRGQEPKIVFVPPANEGYSNVIPPNGLATLIHKEKGAFQRNENENYHVILVPGLSIPYRDFTIETRTKEDFLIENELNVRQGEPLAGAFDGYTTRSMERTEDSFDEEGGAATSWHTHTPCNENFPGASSILGTQCRMNNDAENPIGYTGTNIHDDHRQRTFSSPGESNSDKYEVQGS